MASCNTNSSNLLGNLNINSITSSGARLLMTHPLSGFSGGRISNYIGDDGITAGDAIRYDVISGSPSENKYVKAQANTPSNCEVIGIVEEVSPLNLSDPSSGVVTVVIQGQINYPTSKLVNATHIDAEAGLTGSAGGNDVYFLSAATAGVIQNLAPAEPTQVIKPIYQVAPDGDWTGQVVNYIGYQAGGQVVGEDTHAMVAGSLIEVMDTDTSAVKTSRPGWMILDGRELNLKSSLGPTYGYTFNKIKNICRKTVIITVSTTPSTSLVKKNCFVRSAGRKVLNNATIIDSSVAGKTITARWDSTNSEVLDQYLIADAYLEITNGSRFKIVSIEDLSFTLPTAYSPPALRLKIDNKERTIPKSTWIYLPEDAWPGNSEEPQNFAVSIPNNLTIKEATIEKLTLEDTTATITVLDSLKNLQDASGTYDQVLHGVGSTTSTNTADTRK